MRMCLTALSAALLLSGLAQAETHVLINQVGYDVAASKSAIMRLTGDSRVKPPVSFAVLDSEINRQVLSGTLQLQGVWRTGAIARFIALIFPAGKHAGTLCAADHQ